ncbi:MAG: purine-binding chemotaxis protein CheW [Epsilonproteobacteria bacterium]|nr:purine-binding chemotaxis protein CheW [Campylobacterota bacterium]
MSDQLQNIIKQQQQQQQGNLTNNETKDENIVQLVGFVVGNEEFAVPILSIQEIIKPIEWTKVPFTPDFVLGVFNLRGNVLPLIDLRKKFSAGAAEFDDDVRFIVIKVGDELAGFVIDRLTEALRIEESSILPPPDTSSIEKEAVIEGIARKDGRIITILKISSLLKTNDR